jgi:hypothetical protein
MDNTCKNLPFKKRKFSEYRDHTIDKICCMCRSDVISNTESILIFKRSGRSLCQLCIDDECNEILTKYEEILVQRKYVQKRTINQFMQMLKITCS